MYWDYSDTNFSKHDNLYNIVTKIIANVRFIKAVDFVSKYNNNQDYISNLFFLIFNGLGGTFSQTANTLEGLVECEIDRVLELGKIRLYLIIFAIIIFGGLAIMISVYVTSINSSLNLL